MTLSPVTITVERQMTGDSKVQIQHGSFKSTIRYKKESEDSEDLQVYFNALSRRDNCTYVRIDDVSITKPVVF